jgi:hypothetical protein
MLVKTPLILRDGKTVWGQVVLADKNGAVVREYRINGADVAKMIAGEIKHPPGCTSDEWFAGPSYLAGRPCEDGMCCVGAEGTLMINFGITPKGARLEIKLLKIPAADWKNVNGEIWVEDYVIAELGR